MKYKLNKTYLMWAFLLFVVELIIGFYVKDKWIRPFFGDFLVVILLYCFVKSFVNIRTTPTLIGVLLFSYLIETLQYFRFVELIGLQNHQVASTLIGTFFSWIDMLMYTLGIFTVAIIEAVSNRSASAKQSTV